MITTRKNVAIGKTRTERSQCVARRMWKFYMKHGWYNFNFPGIAAWEAKEKATQ